MPTASAGCICLGWMHTALAGCILPWLNAYCPGWMHSAWLRSIRWPQMHSAAMPGVAGPRGQGGRAGPAERPGAMGQPFWGRRPNALGAAECQLLAGQVECIQPRQYAFSRGSIITSSQCSIRPCSHHLIKSSKKQCYYLKQITQNGGPQKLRSLPTVPSLYTTLYSI